jgi:uncharacterized membrane protein (DUF106 family)
MDIDAINFLKQMLNELDEELNELERARDNNDPRKFSKIKKKCFDINKEISNLIEK